MNRSLAGIALVWLLLLGLLAEQVGLATLLPGRIAPGATLASAACMVAIVGFAFMRLRQATKLAQAFVVAVLFWLVVLLGLGAMDPLTRTDYPVAVTRFP